MEAVLVTLVLDAGSPLHAASKLCIAANGALIVNLISGIFVDMVIVRRQRMNPLHLDQITISSVMITLTWHRLVQAVFAVKVEPLKLHQISRKDTTTRASIIHTDSTPSIFVDIVVCH